MYIVKDTPIRKNKKTYGVGDEFPYSEKDKHLLWNLTVVKGKAPKDGPTDKDVESEKTDDTDKVVEPKNKVAPKKATGTKKKTNSKNK